MFKNLISSEKLKKRVYLREEDIRGHYFRDITAIIHSYPFRRLKHKTQVFFSPKNDHICTRIEHVMHVATISATICKAFNLNVDLAWAISLGHDLGHPPFGHAGENILSEILKDRGGFKHEIYSLRVVDKLINYGKGLNLTYAVRDGIITHCGEIFEKSLTPDFKIKELDKIKNKIYKPATYEGVVVRFADKIAYLGRDLEDAIHLKIIKKEQIPEIVVKRLGTKNSEIINTLVNDLISTSLKNNKISFSDNIFEAVLELKNFNYKNIYKSYILNDYEIYFKRVLKNLYSYLNELFNRFEFDQKKYKKEKNLLSVRFGDFVYKMKDFYLNKDSIENIVIDYIAGMTDDYAIECIKEIMIPKRFEYQFENLLLNDEEEKI